MGPNETDYGAQTEPEERAITPDLQSASGLPGGGGAPPNASLLDSLSGNALPQAALSSLLQPVSQGMGYAEALAGGVAAMRNQPNPVSQIIDRQQQQQLAVSSLLQKMGESQRLATQWAITNKRLQDAETRQEKHTAFQEAETTKTNEQKHHEFLLGVNQSLLDKTTDPAARQALAQERAKLIEKATGQPAPAGTIEGWIAPTPETKEREKQLGMAFSLAGDDPQKQILAAQKFNVDPQTAQYYITNVKDPRFLKDLGLTSNEDIQAQDIQRQVHEQQLIDLQAKRKAPELVGDQKFAMALRTMSQELFPYQNYSDLPEPKRAQVFDALHKQMKIEENEKIRLQEEARTRTMLAGIDARLAAKTAQPANPTVVAKLVQPFDKGVGYLKSIAQLQEVMKSIPDDALPSGESYPAQLWASMKRNTAYKNNQAVLTMRQLWAPISIGLDRGYFDEMNVRSVRAYDKVLETVDNLPPKRVMKAYLDTLDKMIKNQMQTHLDTMTIPESLTPPEAIAKAKFLSAPYLKAKPESILSPGTTQKTVLDLRKDSKTYNKPIIVELEAGEALPPGFVEIKK